MFFCNRSSASLPTRREPTARIPFASKSQEKLIQPPPATGNLNRETRRTRRGVVFISGATPRCCAKLLRRFLPPLNRVAVSNFASAGPRCQRGLWTKSTTRPSCPERRRSFVPRWHEREGDAYSSAAFCGAIFEPISSAFEVPRYLNSGQSCKHADSPYFYTSFYHFRCSRCGHPTRCYPLA